MVTDRILSYIIMSTVILMVNCNDRKEAFEIRKKKLLTDSISSNSLVNPIIRGFNPDPSIIRVGEDYYIATSTFEWYPGIALYHSKDLVHWRPTGHALKNQINLGGYPASGGVYAPSLHYFDSTFYLTYSTVQTAEEAWPLFSSPTYVVNTNDISKEWSTPVYLSSVGFDPSLVFDDGKTYLLNMVQDFRWHYPTMGKIGLQEFDFTTGQPLGDLIIIANFENAIGTEGPHIYKRNNYYYLMVAQGGTFYDHMITVARSPNLTGPYELPDDWPLLTSAGNDTLVLQRAGHGCLVQTQNDEWYVSYLASRSLMPERRSPLGREACLQKVVWNAKNWLELNGEPDIPQWKTPLPDLEPHIFEPLPEKDDFSKDILRVDYQTLRQPQDSSWLYISNGILRMRGRRLPTSELDVSMVARRITSFTTKAETKMTFNAQSYRQKSGISAFYDSRHYYFLAITHDDSLGMCAELTGFDRGKYVQYDKVVLDDPKDVTLGFDIDFDSISFKFKQKDVTEWTQVGSPLYFGNLSDEQDEGSGFTGTMAALLTVDALNESNWADYNYFDVKK